MDRLTEHGKDYRKVQINEMLVPAALNRLAAYEDRGLEPDEILDPIEMAKIAIMQTKFKELQAENAALRSHIVDIAQKVESAEEYALQRYLVWEKTLSENHRDDAQRATANAVMGAYKGLGKMLCDIGQAIAAAGYGPSEGGVANE